MQFRDFKKNRLSIGEQICFWLLLAGPLSLLYFRLSHWLGEVPQEIQLLMLLAWIFTASFAAITLHISGENASGIIERKNSAKLWAAGLLPALLLAVIAAIEWQTLGRFGPGRALLAVAAALALTNGFCWFFAHFGVQELGRPEAPKSFEKHPALHINPAGNRSPRYTSPLNLILATLLMIGFFCFAFILPFRPEAPKSGLLAGLLLIGFVFSLFALLSLNRFHTLLLRAKSEHIGRAGVHPLEEWGPFILGTILLGFFAAASPLDRLVKWGERLRLFKPPRGPAQYSLPQSPPGASGGLEQQAGSLLMLLVLLLLVLFAYFLIRRLNRMGFWRRCLAWFKALGKRLLALLAKWLSPKPSPNEADDLASASGNQPIDVFENTELLSQLSPTQIIIATYHLLLQLATARGWLSGRFPPLETLALLTTKGRLDPENLGLLTWLYLRAAYSSQPLSGDELPQAKKAWGILKYHLLRPELPAG